MGSETTPGSSAAVAGASSSRGLGAEVPGTNRVFQLGLRVWGPRLKRVSGSNLNGGSPKLSRTVGFEV